MMLAIVSLPTQDLQDTFKPIQQNALSHDAKQTISEKMIAILERIARITDHQITLDE